MKFFSWVPVAGVGSLALLAAGLALGATMVAAAPATNLPDPVQGQELAKRICSNCHLVYEGQAKAVADVPTFKEIANKPGQTAGAIVGNIVIPAHPMPVIPITKSELNDLAAYILTLRDEGVDEPTP